jgi:hypothetical protein
MYLRASGDSIALPNLSRMTEKISPDMVTEKNAENIRVDSIANAIISADLRLSLGGGPPGDYFGDTRTI